ncbi:MAG: sensor histidine kinase [Alphaproteobacteria bacterium]|nr:sensor histidine kinase [Alphaproteobacteria bacterium]
MLTTSLVVLVSLGYVGLLFAIAWWGDKLANQGMSLLRSPLVYTLSIAVYCTTWTFYGSVGYAARSGLEFLTIYFGPTVVFLGWWVLLRKMVRISKRYGLTSISDFISSRYGKSGRLSVLVALIAVIGTTPYIALQLKAVSTSFTVLTGMGNAGFANPDIFTSVSILSDTGFWVTLLLVIFAILFGTRHIDASEHHEGVVAAVAFESIIKIIALIAVGIFVVYGLYEGFDDLFSRAAATPQTSQLLTLDNDVGPRWLTLIMLSMAATIALPRQFQMTVIENVNENHLKTASWMFPAYLLIMNIFVLPIALAGLDILPENADPDFFVLTIPLYFDQEFLALIAYIGGLSAATSMVIVAAIALSTMVCNDLVIPALLRWNFRGITDKDDLTGVLITTRRFSIFGVLILGYLYYRASGSAAALVSIGLISFAATAQFVPIMIGGLFWKGGNKKGAQTGLILGFIIWFYTLFAPSIARTGWIDPSFVIDGPWGIGWLHPESLFGLKGMEPLTHALFWSMLLNIGGYILVSIFTRQRTVERLQANLFVNAFQQRTNQDPRVWQGGASVQDIYNLVQRFLGGQRTYDSFQQFQLSRGMDFNKDGTADAATIAFAERLLASSIGSASARIVVSSAVKGEVVMFDEVVTMLEETSHVIEYSHQLETKSRELEALTHELRDANKKLQELDRLKDDFLTVVSHEFRTPLTSIRSFSEILSDHKELDNEQANKFLSIIMKESQRLTRLIDEHLDLARVKAGHLSWNTEKVDPRHVIEDAVASVGGMIEERNVKLTRNIAPHDYQTLIDRDRFVQVLINLLSNAIKFCDRQNPQVKITAYPEKDGYYIEVEDNGLGIPEADREMIFDKFARAGEDDDTPNKPTGSGLGLAISKGVIEHFKGRIWVTKRDNTGAIFKVYLPKIKDNLRGY